MDGNQFKYNKPLNLARIAPLLDILKRKLKADKCEVLPGIVSLQAASHHAVADNSSCLDCVFVSGEQSYISIPVVVDVNMLYTVLLTFEKENTFSSKDRELVDAFQSTLSTVSWCITPGTEAVDAFVSSGTLLASLLLAVQPPLKLVNEASARLLALHIHRDRDNRDRDMRMDAVRELEYRVRRLGAVCRRGALGAGTSGHSGEVPTLSSSSSRSLASATTCLFCYSQSDAEGSTRRYGSSDSNLGGSHDHMYTMGDIGLMLGDYRSVAGEARVGYHGCSRCDRSYLPSTASREASRPSLGREVEQKASRCRWLWRRLRCLGCFWPAAS